MSLFQEENNYIKLGLSQVFSLTRVFLLRRYPLQRFHCSTKQCNLYSCSYNCRCTKNPGGRLQERLHLLSHPESFSNRSSDKTSLKHCLFGEEPPSWSSLQYCTGRGCNSRYNLMRNHWLVSCHKWRAAEAMLGRALKAGIPMKKSLTRFIWASYCNGQTVVSLNWLQV